MGTFQGRVRGRVMDLMIGPGGKIVDAVGNEYSPQEVLHPAYSPTEGLRPVAARADRPMTPVDIVERVPNARRTQNEIMEARSRDGVWEYLRVDGAPGTPWEIRHVPTKLTYSDRSLPRARQFTADPERALAVMRAEHQRTLERYERFHAEQPDHPGIRAEVERLRAIGAATQESEEGSPTHAGVALVAGDTGRVLMLQRSFVDEEDPARGQWEFPGGGVEEDEDPETAARREWAEEIGQDFPADAELRSTWDSEDGVYRGHIFVVPEESVVELHEGRTTVNPDDPDGDDPEQSAWWLPEDAQGNPALRPEVADSPWEEIAMAGSSRGSGELHEASLWDAIVAPGVDFAWDATRRAVLTGSAHAVMDPVVGSVHLAHFGDLELATPTVPDVPAEEAGVEDDPEHALPVTYGEDGGAPVLAGRAQAASYTWGGAPAQRLDGLSAAWQALRSGPVEPATQQEMRAGIPVVASCGCVLAGTNSSARNCSVAPAGVASSREVTKHLAEVRQIGAFQKSVGADLGDVYAARRAVAHEQPVDDGEMSVEGDPYAHLLEGSTSDGDAQVAAAQAFLGSRTALKDFTLAERSEIINEGSGGASNLDRLDLTGTHYQQMPAVDDDDLTGWL